MKTNRSTNYTHEEVLKIMDAVFAPDIRITHNELGEIMAVKALTDAGRDYVAHNLIMRYSSIDGLQLDGLFVEYVDLSDIAQ